MRSQFYIFKENKKWVVLAKSKRTGPKSIDDVVMYRGCKSAALKKLASMRKKEIKENI